MLTPDPAPLGSRSRLEVEADRINYKLRLDSKALELADRKANIVRAAVAGRGLGRAVLRR